MLDKEAYNYKYKIVNYDLDVSDESALLASQKNMERDLNEWGEGRWSLVSLVHVSNIGSTMRMMATLVNSQYLGAKDAVPESWSLPE